MSAKRDKAGQTEQKMYTLRQVRSKLPARCVNAAAIYAHAHIPEQTQKGRDCYIYLIDKNAQNTILKIREIPLELYEKIRSNP